jgi:hypothetical protein
LKNSSAISSPFDFGLFSQLSGKAYRHFGINPLLGGEILELRYLNYTPLPDWDKRGILVSILLWGVRSLNCAI